MAQERLNGGDFWTAIRRKVNSNSAALVAALQGAFVVSPPGVAIGSTKSAVANIAFTYTIAGLQYSKAAVAAGTAVGSDVVPLDLFGAVALDIDAAGTITVAKAALNTTGYASAALAIDGIPAVASTKARMGTVTVTGDAAFTFGTTLFDAADTTVAFTDGLSAANSI